MDLFMRDVYPDMGTVEISTAVQPDESELITEHDDQAVAQLADNGTRAAGGSSKRNLVLAFVLLVIIAVVWGVVE